ncbi:MAG TPA: cbb3-type cytochrome c oxidase subunit I [Solirubrobacterales bacterium]|jgi:cytochrome c oxidase subunit 1|nr:cbb3-type cytochrome c oxidase subunit I [Solirubrobacterales bacterium]
MSNGRTLAPHRPELVTDSPAPTRPRWLEMVMSSDHKDVGRVYIGASLSFLVLGIVAFLLIRLQLAVPENNLIEPVTFNRLLSVGSATLIVLFALPLVFGLFTYVIPLQIGSRSLAFPRLASLSLWLYLFGGALLYVSFVYTPPEGGFNSWPPLSDTAFISNNGIDVWITAVGLTVLGLVLLSINLAVTVSKLRAPGLAWRRLPTFSFSAAVSSWTMIIAGTAMVAALVMLEIDRHFNGVFFDPGEGGAPLYYQHLSWIFFTGCYLLFLMPAFGAISEILPVFSGKPLLSRRAMVISLTAIMPLGLLAWMQNMMSASIPIGFLYAAMLMALLLVIPIGAIFVNWLGTLAGGVLRMRAPLVFALAAISTLSFGLILELIQSVIPVNWLLGDTTASTAASGYVLVGGAVLGGFAALYYWFPKMTGRVMGEGLARSSATLIVLGAHLTFIPLFLAGLEGQQVDIFKFFEASDAINSMSLNAYNLIATIGAFVLSLGMVLTIMNAYASLKNGVRTGPDPWGGETLEWFATSPPPPHNFDVVPDVRSDEPLRDIREAVRRRDASRAEPSEMREPVA